MNDTTEDIRRKLVNGQCVKVMGWHRGTGRYSDGYFHDTGGLYGTYICQVEDYNPYNNIEQMEPVIDSLISSLGLRLNTGLVQTKGILGASQQLILDNIMSEEDKDELLGIDKLIRLDEASAALMEAEEQEELEEMIKAFAPEEDVLDVEEGWDEYDRLEMTHPMYDNNLQEWIEENTKRQFEHSLRLNIGYDDSPNCDREITEGRVMKKLDDILKGFDLIETTDDGTKHYSTKDMHFIEYDYWQVHHMVIYPNGNIDLSVDVNCDLFEGANDLEQYHVYGLTEIA